MTKIDDHWIGRMDEKMSHCEKTVTQIIEHLERIRKENQECRIELKSEIHDLAKWRERVLVYLVAGGFIAAYAAKHVLDIYFN